MVDLGREAKREAPPAYSCGKVSSAQAPTRVLCFCEKWESGGIEAFVTNVLTCMDRADLQVDLVACIVQPGPYDERLAAADVRPTALGTSLHAVSANLRAFRELLQANRYDAVHLNLYEGLALLFAREAKRAGVPRVIVHSHNNDIRPGVARPVKLALHRACVARLNRYADLRWAPSQTTARFLFGDRPWTQVKNGIAVEKFSFDSATRNDARAELGLDSRFVVGCVGRLCDQKNQLFLLDMLPELLKSVPQAVLLFVGDDDSGGEARAAIEKRVAEQGLADHVVLHGPTRDVARLYQAMDVLCMPSLFEGLGIVAIEAQVAGLPVMASPAVPPEAAVTDLFRTLELEPATWAHALAATRGAARTSRADDVEKAGYDIPSVAAWVRAAYRCSDAGELPANPSERGTGGAAASPVELAPGAPLVSVIVPVYGVEAYLDECLASIERQTYANLQIIVVDDASPDGCGAICDEHARADGRITVVHRAQNGGLSQARNDGLDLCEGTYIAFVDGDDAVAPQFVEKLLAQGADIAQCAFSTERERVLGLSLGQCGSHAATRATGKEASEALQLDGTGACTVVWNKLYRRALFDDVRFPVGKQHEDEFVTYRLLWDAATVATVSDELYWYRQRPQSIMEVGVSAKSLDAIEALDQRTAFYRAQGEHHLAALSAAVECYRACDLLARGSGRLARHHQTFLKALAKRSYRFVLASDVPKAKKLALTLQMLSPRLYQRFVAHIAV